MKILTSILTVLILIIIFLAELIGFRFVWDDLMVPVFKCPELTTWQLIELLLFVRIFVNGVFSKKAPQQITNDNNSNNNGGLK